ncbi:DNA mismatch repair protein [Cyanidiococcus yangmingshanensis]|uniref:DNA mismatch repair protein n=1 Tax=Cyanidiococcus yangmingshanensis TaxID=2690220 RepID=A0A7J7IQW7_9RHOD|nr:DNA mismatch repair protein [Cyanidiococcus yangmingshanensis]
MSSNAVSDGTREVEINGKEHKDGVAKLMPRIQALAPEVVNRIAAGEVVARPSSALKELLENAIDAGSTQVSVTVVRGGVVRLEIVDNGCGIFVEDAPQLCQRYSTSKLRALEDLSNIATCGFRGEALAAISYVAEIRVVSCSLLEDFGWTASYRDGVVIAPGARPAARTSGSTIVVSDMFRSIPSKFESFIRNQAEEYRQMLNIVARYAIYHSGRIAMRFRKREQSDARTLGADMDDLNTNANATHMDNIRRIFGHKLVSGLGQVSRTELHRVQHPILGTKLSTDIVLERAFYSKLGASQPKAVHIYFVNGRLVECRVLRKAIEQLYAKYYLKGPHYPFCYLELTMAPEILDVNVHPTKKEVRFLDEQIVFRAIVDILERELIQSGKQQSFVVQPNPSMNARGVPSVSGSIGISAGETVSVGTAQSDGALAGRKRLVTEVPPSGSDADGVDTVHQYQDPLSGCASQEHADDWARLCSEQQERRQSQRFSMRTVRASQRIRVDAHTPKLERWHSTNGTASQIFETMEAATSSTRQPTTGAIPNDPSAWSEPESFRVLTLLKQECVNSQSFSIAEVFRLHTFVGAIDERFSLIQFGTALIAVDLRRVLEGFYFQNLLDMLQERYASSPTLRLRPSWLIERHASDSPATDTKPEAIPNWKLYTSELYHFCGIHLCPNPLCSVIDRLDALKTGHAL